MTGLVFIIYISFLILFCILDQVTDYIYGVVKKKELTREVGKPSFLKLARDLSVSTTLFTVIYGLGGFIYLCLLYEHYLS